MQFAFIGYSFKMKREKKNFKFCGLEHDKKKF